MDSVSPTVVAFVLDGHRAAYVLARVADADGGSGWCAAALEGGRWATLLPACGAPLVRCVADTAPRPWSTLLRRTAELAALATDWVAAGETRRQTASCWTPRAGAAAAAFLRKSILAGGPSGFECFADARLLFYAARGAFVAASPSGGAGALWDGAGRTGVVALAGGEFVSWRPCGGVDGDGATLFAAGRVAAVVTGGAPRELAGRLPEAGVVSCVHAPPALYAGCLADIAAVAPWLGAGGAALPAAIANDVAAPEEYNATAPERAAASRLLRRQDVVHGALTATAALLHDVDAVLRRHE